MVDGEEMPVHSGYSSFSSTDLADGAPAVELTGHNDIGQTATANWIGGQ